MSACRWGDESAASTSSSTLTSLFQHKVGDFVTALAVVVLWGCGDDAGAATAGPPPPEPVCTLPQGSPHVVAIEGAEAFSLHVALLSNGDLHCWGNDGVGACGSKFLSPVRSTVASCLASVKLEAGTLMATEAWSPPRDPARPLLVWGYDARRNLETDASGLGRIEISPAPTVYSPDNPFLFYHPETGPMWMGSLRLDDAVPPAAVVAQTPTPLSLPGPVVDFASLTEACAVIADGRLFCWGWGPYGSLGLGSLLSVADPTEVASPESICEVEIGFHWMCSRACSGSVYCAGANYSGRIDPALPGDVTALTRIAGLPALDSIWLETSTGCGISQGDVWCWGNRNIVSGGETGDPPTKMSDFGDVVDVSLAGEQSLCVLRADGTIWCDGLARGDCVPLPSGWQPVDLHCAEQP